MGRVREHIKINGKKFWTLFDTGARNTYVVPSVASRLVTSKLPRTFRTALGKGIKQTNKGAVLNADVQGCKISTLAMVIDEIGKDEDGKPIEVLFGALAMQNWGIRPIPDEEKLDLSHYPKEFVEFQLAQQCGDEAMALLKQAVAKGYKDAAHMKQDKDQPQRRRTSEG